MSVILVVWEGRRKKFEHKHFLLQVEKVFVFFLCLFVVKVSADSREESPTVLHSTTFRSTMKEFISTSQAPKNDISKKIVLRLYNYNLEKYAGKYLLVTKYYVLAHLPNKVCKDSIWKFDYMGPRMFEGNPFRKSTKSRDRRKIEGDTTLEIENITNDSLAIENDMSVIEKNSSVITNETLVDMTFAANNNSVTKQSEFGTANVTSETTKETTVSMEDTSFIVNDKNATEKDMPDTGKYMLMREKFKSVIVKEPTIKSRSRSITVKDTSVTSKEMSFTTSSTSMTVTTEDAPRIAKTTSMTANNTFMPGKQSLVTWEGNNAAPKAMLVILNDTSSTSKISKVSEKNSTIVTKDTLVVVKHTSMTTKDNSIPTRLSSVEEKHMSVLSKDTSITAKNSSFKARDNFLPSNGTSILVKPTSFEVEDASASSKGTFTTLKHTSVKAEAMPILSNGASMTAKHTSIKAKAMPILSNGTSMTAKHTSIKAEVMPILSNGTSMTAKHTSIKAEAMPILSNGTSMTAKHTSIKADLTPESSKGTSMIAKYTSIKVEAMPVSSKGTSMTTKHTSVKVEDTSAHSKVTLSTSKIIDVIAKRISVTEDTRAASTNTLSTILEIAGGKPSKGNGISATEKQLSAATDDNSLTNNSVSAAAQTTSETPKRKSVVRNDLTETTSETSEHMKNKSVNVQYTNVTAIDNSVNAVNSNAIHKNISLTKNVTPMTGNNASIEEIELHVRENDSEKVNTKVRSIVMTQNKTLSTTQDEKQYTTAYGKNYINSIIENDYVEGEYNDKHPTAIERMNKRKPEIPIMLSAKENRTVTNLVTTITDNASIPIEYYDNDNTTINSTEDMFTHDTEHTTSSKAIFTTKHKYQGISGKGGTISMGKHKEDEFISGIKNEYLALKTTTSPYQNIYSTFYTATKDVKNEKKEFKGKSGADEVETGSTSVNYMERVKHSTPNVENKFVYVSNTTFVIQEENKSESLGGEKGSNVVVNSIAEGHHSERNSSSAMYKKTSRSATKGSTDLTVTTDSSDEMISHENVLISGTKDKDTFIFKTDRGSKITSVEYDTLMPFEIENPKKASFTTDRSEEIISSLGQDSVMFSETKNKEKMNFTTKFGTIMNQIRNRRNYVSTVSGGKMASSVGFESIKTSAIEKPEKSTFTTDRTGEIISSLGHGSVIISGTNDKENSFMTNYDGKITSSIGFESIKTSAIEKPEKSTFTTDRTAENISSILQESTMVSDFKEESTSTTQHSSEIVVSSAYESVGTFTLEKPEKSSFTTDRSVEIIPSLSHESIMISVTEKKGNSPFIMMKNSIPQIGGAKIQIPTTKEKNTSRVQSILLGLDRKKMFKKVGSSLYPIPTCQTMTDGVLLFGGFSKCDQKRLMERDASTSRVIERHIVHTRCNGVPYEGVKSHENVSSGPGWFLLHFPVEQVPYYLTTFKVEYRKKGDKAWKSTRFSRSLTFKSTMPRVMPGYPCPPWETYSVFCIMLSDHVRVGNKEYEDYEAQIVTQGLAPQDAQWNNSELEYRPKRYSFTFRINNCDPTLAQSCPPDSTYRQEPPEDPNKEPEEETDFTEDSTGNYTNTEDFTGNYTNETTTFVFNGTTIPWPTENETTTTTTQKPPLPFFLDPKFWYLLLVVDLLIAILVFFVVYMWAKSRAFTRELGMIQVLNPRCVPVQLILKAPPESIRLGCSRTLMEPSPCPSGVVSSCGSISSFRDISSASSGCRLPASNCSWRTQSDPGAAQRARRPPRLRSSQSY